MGRGVRVGGGVVKYICWDLSVNGHLGSRLSTAVSGYMYSNGPAEEMT